MEVVPSPFPKDTGAVKDYNQCEIEKGNRWTEDNLY